MSQIIADECGIDMRVQYLVSGAVRWGVARDGYEQFSAWGHNWGTGLIVRATAPTIHKAVAGMFTVMDCAKVSHLDMTDVPLTGNVRFQLDARGSYIWITDFELHNANSDSFGALCDLFDRELTGWMDWRVVLRGQVYEHDDRKIRCYAPPQGVADALLVIFASDYRPDAWVDTTIPAIEQFLMDAPVCTVSEAVSHVGLA